MCLIEITPIKICLLLKELNGREGAIRTAKNILNKIYRLTRSQVQAQVDINRYISFNQVVSLRLGLDFKRLKKKQLWVKWWTARPFIF